VHGADVLAAARACHDALEPACARDWKVSVPDLDWTVARVVAHAADCCLWYAVDLAAGDTEHQPMELTVDPDAPPAEILGALDAFAGVLASVVDTAPEGARGFHEFGIADVSGFAAMACDEVLVHTDDAARGLSLSFDPDPALCERTVRRLFPWAPADTEPWAALRWANGRSDLPGQPRVGRWKWHCAPLAEWDGRPRFRPRM